MQAINLIDTSSISLGIGCVVFILVTFIVKYILDSYENDNESEEKRNYYVTLLYSFLVGIVGAVISLVVFKQIKTYDSDDILTHPFPVGLRLSA